MEAIATDAPNRLKSRALESLCQLVHKNFICPFSFKQATLISLLTRSKTSRQIIASCLPAGGKDSLERLLNATAEGDQRPILPGHCDNVCSFDNQQILGRHHTLIAYRSNPISTCTAVYHAFYSDSVVQLDPTFELERSLGPGHCRTGSEEQLRQATALTGEEEMIATSEMKQLFGSMISLVEREKRGEYDTYMNELGLVIDRIDFNRSCMTCWTPAESKT